MNTPHSGDVNPVRKRDDVGIHGGGDLPAEEPVVAAGGVERGRRRGAASQRTHPRAMEVVRAALEVREVGGVQVV